MDEPTTQTPKHKNKNRLPLPASLAWWRLWCWAFLVGQDVVAQIAAC